MHPSVGSIIKNSIRKNNEKLNILTFSTHERYQSNMSDINADFWVINNTNIKGWNLNFSEIPKNHYLLNNIYSLSDVPVYINFDIVLSQSRFSQFEFAKKIARYFRIPLVSLEHTVMNEMTKDFISMNGDFNVFISEFSAKSWKINKDYSVIEHGIDNTVFHNKNLKRQNEILSVVNDWINRDYECGFKLWKQITENLPTKVVGDTPSLSKPAKNTEELVDFYNRSSIFLNTSIHSPIPTTLLEAMSCGCCVVTTSNEMISKVINNGENGFISNNKEELKKYLNLCLNNADLCKEIGKNARQTIIEKFSIKDFTENWNNVLRKCIKD